MNAATYPLLQAFVELRKRRFPIGLAEYLTALRALRGGFGEGSRDRLIAMCQTVWAYSTESRDEIAQVLRRTLPAQVTAEEAEKRLSEALRMQTDASPDEPGGARPPVTDDDSRPDVPPATASHDVSTEEGQSLSFGRATFTGATAPLIGLTTSDFVVPRDLDLIGTMPVSRRELNQAWRSVRRMRRIGRPMELDVDGTVRKASRHGVFTAPVMRSRRRNLASLALLVDSGGSMAPFESFVGALELAAARSGKSRFETWYFHDVPREHLFRDRHLRRPAAISDALAPFDGGGLAIVSDAGAARGGDDPHRAEATARFFRRIVGPLKLRYVWLNPVPAKRWPGTTAGRIVEGGVVPMFAIDRAGLVEAMDVLRGRD